MQSSFRFRNQAFSPIQFRYSAFRPILGSGIRRFSRILGSRIRLQSKSQFRYSAFRHIRGPGFQRSRFGVMSFSIESANPPPPTLRNLADTQQRQIMKIFCLLFSYSFCLGLIFPYGGGGRGGYISQWFKINLKYHLIFIFCNVKIFVDISLDIPTVR